MKIPQLLLFLLLPAAAAAWEVAPRVIQMFGGADNVATVIHATKVDACILRYTPPNSTDRAPERYDETPFVTLSEASAQYFSFELLHDGAYLWDLAVACRPRYHTRLRFHRDKDIVAVDFCFTCKVLRIFHNGREVGGGLFERRKVYFLDGFRKLFPEDLAIGKER